MNCLNPVDGICRVGCVRGCMYSQGEHNGGAYDMTQHTPAMTARTPSQAYREAAKVARGTAPIMAGKFFRGQREQAEKCAKAIESLAAAAEAESRLLVVDMVLFCPKCGMQHIDAPDERTPDWKNPPHKSHLCHGCGTIWRPSDTCTNGVTCTESGKDAPKPSGEREAVLQLPPLTDAMYWAVRGTEITVSSGGSDDVTFSLDDDTLDEIWEAINTALRVQPNAALATPPASAKGDEVKMAEELRRSWIYATDHGMSRITISLDRQAYELLIGALTGRSDG